MPVHDSQRCVFELIKEWIAPFSRWEGEMERLLQRGADEDLQRYAEIAELYQRHNGYAIDAMIDRECAELGLAPETFRRSYGSLSGGEQTRAMIAALFLKTDSFPLLDEPTNHLDMNGREELGAYLSRKQGFIVVSHDRSFLYRIPGHVSVANGYQHPLWMEGLLRGHLQDHGIEETRFRTIMGTFGVCGDIFDRPLETFSRGELKKVDLCRSFQKPHHLLLWDEPVNYIDIPSRVQIEDVILRDAPTMLFTEHDRTFVDKIATDVIVLKGR